VGAGEQKMKRMLFNATQTEELRVAIVDGQKLVDLDIETTGREQRKSNIYKGVITRIEPSLEAAFIDYGADRHGFLPFKEVSRSYFNNPDADPARARIQDALKEGQQLIVQVDKDERGTKGAALTTFISLAGRYLVLMPNNPRGGGVSRRIEGEERNEVRDAIAQLEVPQGMSTIARTAGIGRSVEELQWDLSYLLQLWRAIDNAAGQQSGAFLIYQDASLVIRAIRDYFHQDIGELLIDTESIYEQAHQFMGHVMPQNVSRVKLYKDDVPLFSRFQIEHQIETAYSRQVSLPSGGSVVIDHTEALVSIDVNSARATKGSDIEETALRTNLEASDEIARQLRLRDLGGLVVIDYIDMDYGKNQRDVEQRLRDALKYDRARVQTGKISRFGLLELSRQRLQTSLGETSHIACPRCSGTGHIRSIESTALHVLRILQEEAMKENTAAIHAQVPVDVATYLLNEKRSEFHQIEQRLKVNCLLIPNIHLETPHYSLTRLRHDELNQNDITVPSYTLSEIPPEQIEPHAQGQKPELTRPEAAVQGVTPSQPAPARPPEKIAVREEGPSVLQKIIGWFTSPAEQPAEESKSQEKTERPSRPRRDDRGGSSRRRGGKDQRERSHGRKPKSESASASESESGEQRDNTRQRQKPAEARKPGRREQTRQPAKERAETADTAAIERSTAEGAQADANGEPRTGRRRRRRGRGSEGRNGERSTVTTTDDKSPQDKTVQDNAAREMPSTSAESTAAASSQAAISAPDPVRTESVRTEPVRTESIQTETVQATSADQQPMTPESSESPPRQSDRAEEGSARRSRPDRAKKESAGGGSKSTHDESGNRSGQRADNATVEAGTTESIQIKADTVETASAASMNTETEVAKASSQSAPTSQSTESANTVESSKPRSSGTAAPSTPNTREESVVATSAPASTAQESTAAAPVAPATPAAAATGGWKMDAIQLPADMELVETKLEPRPTPDETAVKPKKPRQRRRPAAAKVVPPSPESLVQVETRGEAEAENADNG
jgi:ribonuclease E